MKKIFKFSPSIISIFLLLMLPAFIALICFVYISNNKISNSISARLIDRFKFETELSVIDQINPTRSLVNSAAAVGSINPQFFNKDESWKYLKSILSQQETSMSAYAGGQDGSFRQVRRFKAGSKIQNVAITEEMKYGLRWIPKDRSSDSYIFINDGNENIGTSVATTDYDPRTRPWYKEAALKNKLIITDPYIFSTTGLPGVTVAAPFFDKNAIAGVVAVDISLETISEFLLSNSISDRTISVIYDSMGIIIASSEKRDTFRLINNKVELNNISSLTTNLPALAIAMRKESDKSQLILPHPETGEEYIAVFSKMPNNFEKKWNILSITPIDDFKGEFNRNNQIIFYFGILLIVLQIILFYLYARKISRPLEIITETIQGLIEFKKSPPINIHTNIHELSVLSLAIKKLASTITAFTSYIPRDVVNDLLTSGKPIEVGGESRYLTILFTDLKDFSSLSEITPTRELLKRVSSYFEVMTLAIKEENGTVDKFIGDAVMAFWGAPLLDERHAYHACVAAIKSKIRMESLNAKLISEGKPPLYVRIGIHSDAVLVGNIGSAERLSYTVMGDGVNIASRLEGINKEYGTQICISHSVFKEAGERLWLRPIDQISVKGRKGELIIYEVVGIRDGHDETQATEIQKIVCGLTETAFGLYLEKRYLEAMGIYQEILDISSDSVAKVMIEKCAVHSQQGS
jgi:adenylate cyclase